MSANSVSSQTQNRKKRMVMASLLAINQTNASLFSMDDVIERRKFSRVPFTTRATVTGINSTADGAVTNLSLQGMLFTCGINNLNTGEDVEIEIHLTGATTNLAFILNGQIHRKQIGTIAIKFDLKNIDVESLTHLRYMVGYALGDADRVMEEYKNFIADTPLSAPPE